ncbi:MAG: cache domain-containing protein, partial [Bacteroidota bacterium]|nr:cache domain-containing protein [Bacteroidota bacterium]
MLKFKKLQNRLVIYLGGMVLFIILALSLTNYYSVRKALIKDVTEKQLLSFVEASQSNIQSLLEKAFETSELLANDPTLLKWYADGEKDENLGILAKNKITTISEDENYFTVFAVNNTTKHYWAEGNNLLDVVDKNDADDSWYFSFRDSNKDLVLNFDYNNELQKTLIFVNKKMTYKGKFQGISGVGINPDKIVKEFRKKKLTENSKLWLINPKGEIKMAQNSDEINSNLNKYILSTHVTKILSQGTSGVINDVDVNNIKNEIAYMEVGNTGFYIVVSSPINELMYLLKPIRNNTFIFATIFLLLTIVVVIL